MRTLLKIVGAGFLVFMVLAIADEWALFSAAWFGDGAGDAAPPVDEAEQKAAADAVHRCLTLMRHLYLSGGDPRFADRMPAADGVKEEMLADIVYLGRRHLLQDPDLQRLDVMGVEALAEDRLELRTRELWRFRVLRAAGGEEVEPARMQTIEATYLVARGGAGWRVEGWQLEPPAAERSAE